MSDSATPRTVAHQTPRSVRFPKQEYGSGLPFPPLGDLPNSGFEPASSTLQADSLPLNHQGSFCSYNKHSLSTHLVQSLMPAGRIQKRGNVSNFRMSRSLLTSKTANPPGTEWARGSCKATREDSGSSLFWGSYWGHSCWGGNAGTSGSGSQPLLPREIDNNYIVCVLLLINLGHGNILTMDISLLK